MKTKSLPTDKRDRLAKRCQLSLNLSLGGYMRKLFLFLAVLLWKVISCHLTYVFWCPHL